MAKRLVPILAMILVIMALYVCMLAVAELPPYGNVDNPAHNYVYERYVNNALEETGVLNIVTAIILDYRSYDTLIEATVLFTSIMAVLITLKKGEQH